MMNANNYTAKPSVIESFYKTTGLNLIDAFKAEPVKNQKARFKTREVSEELNKRLLALQGVTAKNVRLYNSKEDAPADCKTVYLVILINDYVIKSYYSARYSIGTEPERQQAETVVKLKAGAKTINDKPVKNDAPVKLVSVEELPKTEPTITETVTLTKAEYQLLLDAIELKVKRKKSAFDFAKVKDIFQK
jgi:hypothetical protein